MPVFRESVRCWILSSRAPPHSGTGTSRTRSLGLCRAIVSRCRASAAIKNGQPLETITRRHHTKKGSTLAVSFLKLECCKVLVNALFTYECVGEAMLSHLHRTDTVLLFIVEYPSVWELGSVQKFAPLCSSCYFATLYVHEAFVFGSSLVQCLGAA